MEQYKEVYIDRQKALGNASPILPKAKNTVHLFKDKDTIFQAGFSTVLVSHPSPVYVLCLNSFLCTQEDTELPLLVV